MTATGPLAAPATDEVPGLSRVTQLVLRGDGLTTTSLEILTGRPITVRVLAHWVWHMGDGLEALAPAEVPHTAAYSGLVPHDAGTGARMAHGHLRARDRERLLIREILLVDDRGAVHGASAVVAVLDRLDPRVARSLARSDEPIGRTLHAHSVPVTRELLRWGLRPAGRRAHQLPSAASPEQRIPARDYLMRLVATGEPLAVFTEWFDPALFDQPRTSAAPPGAAAGCGRPPRRGRR